MSGLLQQSVFFHQNTVNQPSLDDVAAAVGLSPYHFQRLFRRWAGITPKRFLQYLTVDHAKQLLDNSSVLETTMEVGLSSQSRLYDHFVTLEAMTPGEYKRAGMSVEIYYGIGSTPFGNAFIAATERGICQLSFIDQQNFDDALNTLRKKWPKAELQENSDRAATLAKAIFNHPPKTTADFSLLVQGSNFQIKVWESLLRIPSGILNSYGQVAASIGHPFVISCRSQRYWCKSHRLLNSLPSSDSQYWRFRRIPAGVWSVKR